VINGAHAVIYSKDPEADRPFFRDILGFPSVDAGHGWLIFGLPTAEAAFHPADGNDRHELFLMCDDLKAEIAALEGQGVKCSAVAEERWGSITKIPLPGGGRLVCINQSIPGRKTLVCHLQSRKLAPPCKTFQTEAAAASSPLAGSINTKLLAVGGLIIGDPSYLTISSMCMNPDLPT